MARKRQLDPCIWVSEQFISLTELGARLLYIGMISNADDEGRMKASPHFLKTTIYAGDSYTQADLLIWRSQIVEVGLINIYEIDGVEYLFLPTWKKYQYISRPYPSKIPAPPASAVASRNVHGALTEHSHTTHKTAVVKTTEPKMDASEICPKEHKPVDITKVSAPKSRPKKHKAVDIKNTDKEKEGDSYVKKEGEIKRDSDTIHGAVTEHSVNTPVLQHSIGIGIDNGIGIGIVNKEKTNKNQKDGEPEKNGALAINNFIYYEKHIGKITQNLSQKLIDAEEEYSPEWVAEALEIGKEKESCSWAYIETVLKNAKRIGTSPKEINTKRNGHTPKELDEQIIGILNKTEGILNLKFSYRADEYKHVKHGIELGYTTEDFLGCVKAMKADKYWKDIAVIPMKSIVKQMPAFKAGKFKPQPPTESEKRYSIEDYLPKEEKPTK